jgi:hypothetical protein
MAIGEQTRQIRHHLRMICADVGSSGEVGRSSEVMCARHRNGGGLAPGLHHARFQDAEPTSSRTPCDREPCTQVYLAKS